MRFDYTDYITAGEAREMGHTAARDELERIQRLSASGVMLDMQFETILNLEGALQEVDDAEDVTSYLGRNFDWSLA